MKRVLLITDIFPPDIGGPATFMAALADALAAAGHRVGVICRAERRAVNAGSNGLFQVWRLPRQAGRGAALQVAGVIAAQALRHDVVFSNGLEAQTELACRLTGRPYVLKVVGDLAWERARLRALTKLSVDAFQQAPDSDSTVRSWIRRRQAFARHARRVLVPSQYLRRLVTGWGVPAEQVFVVSNGVTLEDYAALAPRQRVGGVFNILYVGRLVNWKGVEHLLAAVAAMRGARLVIAGDGPDEPALRALAGQLEAPVEFCGPLAKNGVLARLAEAHVLALPSEYEGLSHTLLEACAAAVPCVASDRGGNPEVIEPGRSGLLVPYGEVGALRQALERLQADEDLRLTLAAGAKARSRHFDFGQTVAATMAHLVA